MAIEMSCRGPSVFHKEFVFVSLSPVSVTIIMSLGSYACRPGNTLCAVLCFALAIMFLLRTWAAPEFYLHADSSLVSFWGPFLSLCLYHLSCLGAPEQTLPKSFFKASASSLPVSQIPSLSPFCLIFHLQFPSQHLGAG